MKTMYTQLHFYIYFQKMHGYKLLILQCMRYMSIISYLLRHFPPASMHAVPCFTNFILNVPEEEVSVTRVLENPGASPIQQQVIVRWREGPQLVYHLKTFQKTTLGYISQIRCFTFTGLSPAQILFSYKRSGAKERQTAIH